jgi:hypothetical protein
VYQKNVLVRLLGTRFTNAISCFKSGPQEPYREIETPCITYIPYIYFIKVLIVLNKKI